MNPSARNAILAAFEWICLLAAAAVTVLAISLAAGSTLAASAALLALAYGLHGMRTGQWFPSTGLEIPLFLYLVSTVIAAWIAYDRAPAMLQTGRTLAALGLFFALAGASPRVKSLVAAGVAMGAALLAVLVFLRPEAVTPAAAPTLASSALAASLPFTLALAISNGMQRRWAAAALAGALLLPAVASLVRLQTISAWLGVLFAAGLSLLFIVLRRGVPASRRSILVYSPAAFAVLLLAGGALLAQNTARLAALAPAYADYIARPAQIWPQAFPLIRDYFFTGSGLMTFRLVHPVYGLLIHTPFLNQVDNTYLQIWIEQGILAVIALAWAAAALVSLAGRLLGSEASDPRKPFMWEWAGLFALAAIAMNSLFDVAFYGTPLTLLVGLAWGMAWPAARNREAPSTAFTGQRFLRLGMAAAGLALALLVFYRPLLAAWYANLGALAQTQIELRQYRPEHFDNPTLDRIRQTSDLSAAEVEFNRALAVEPANRTALHRLAQIALSRLEADNGLALMQTAWDHGYRDASTRLLMGDALAANGQPQAAADLVRGAPWAVHRLMGQAWYRYLAADDFQRAADAYQTVLLLEPANHEASYWFQRAQSRLP